ncbi:centriolar coiled-coil protein of 110 kDa-like [Anarhichas minor]|uniref:centriolar coiled-coil protein of 110 kDa-like n=1 Tax=Anarhichas minor TaxID=65739 RepID=UPI003F73978E
MTTNGNWKPRKPRPVSTGNINISFPIGPADLIPRSPVRSGEVAGMADWGESLSGAMMSPSHRGSVGSESGNRRSSHCGTSPVQEPCSPISASGFSPKGHLDHLAAGFRRRCHTLNSQLHSCHSGVEHIDCCFPSPVSSSVSSPSVQPPGYLWGPTLAVSKPRARLSLVMTAEQQRAFCRIGAIIRGFLTRRLLKTEKVKHLRQTILDTQEFIRSFQTEGPQKRGPCSAQDRSLQERVRAQLRAALYDIHDIFFEMPLWDRLALLQQDRELRAERKLRDMEKAKGPKERVVLSAATQRSLDRKKRVGESPSMARKKQQKPKSPTTNRVLKPNQGQNSPVPGQLNRQGSWYRKTPEERVRRSDSLKKQHSLG